jgi:CO/xanthine dehydrogenase FAD-binding subunit
MPEFAYVRPTSLVQAVACLNEPGVRSRVLAGGTDLLVRLRRCGADWDRLVDVTFVPELKRIQADGCVTVGAAVTFTEILASPILQAHAPVLVQACKEIGSVQIRNTATIGGNVANAAAAADSVPALVCLDAHAIVVSPRGERAIPVSDLILHRNQLALDPGDLIRAFVFQPPYAGSRMAFERVVRRQAMAIARLSLAAIGMVQDGRITSIRLAPGAIFDHYGRVSPVEQMLLGGEPSAELFAAAGRRMVELYRSESGGRWSAEYKELALAAVTERALQRVVGGSSEI